MKLTPLADRVILKMVEIEEIGEGVTRVKVGDRVITDKYAGTKVTLEDTEYVVVRQHDILAIVE